MSFGFWSAIGYSKINSQLKSAATETVSILENISFSAKNKGINPVIDENKKNEIIPILNKLPKEHTSTLKNLVLDYNPSAGRGLGRGDLIILRAVNIGNKEFFGVLIHEIGHSVDMGLLKNNTGGKSEFKDFGKAIYENDPSLDFYRISWLNDKNRKKNASNEDFVSGYAMTDPFEDFAESYVYYVLHNKSFKSKARLNNALWAKYSFIKNLFNNNEFETGVEREINVKIPWDITILDYDLKRFLKG